MMQGRAQIIEQIADDARAHQTGRPIRRLFRVAHGGEGGLFVQELTATLSKLGRQVIRFELPEYGLDATEHVLGQLCQELGLERVPGRAWDYKLTVHQRVEDVTSEIAKRDDHAPVLALYVPRSWFRRPEDPRRSLPDNAMSVLHALLDPRFSVIVAAASTPSWLERRLGAFAADLPMPASGEGYLFEGQTWRELGDAARRLASIIGSGAFGQPPLVLRLGVACISLGQPERTLQQIFQGPEPYPDLVQLLRDTLKQHPSWKPALGRLTLPRFPVPHALFDEVAGEMSDEQRALAICLAREEGAVVKADEALREIIGAWRRAEPDANERLMRHYRASDGAPNPREAAERGTMLAWLEGNHHEVHRGPEKPENVKPLSWLSRYELAWSLSAEFKEYEAAAAVYREIVKENKGDAYSHHYLAWNLDQAGKAFKIAWDEYKAALDIEPDNPWYNSRFITFLRDNGFPREAREAWRSALTHVRASPRWGKMANLSKHLHRWVIRSALDAGDLDLAQEVLDSLTPRELDKNKNQRLRDMQKELAHLSEVDRLGEQIYPMAIDVGERWKSAIGLPKTILAKGKEARLLKYYPGRVVSVDRGAVVLLLADPGRNPPALFTAEFDEAKAAELAGGDPARVGRFLELGVYEKDISLICYFSPAKRSFQSPKAFLHSLRYLRDDAMVDA